MRRTPRSHWLLAALALLAFKASRRLRRRFHQGARALHRSDRHATRGA